MTMEELEIVEFIFSALSAGDETVDFQQISVLKEQESWQMPYLASVNLMI
jgi:hypothetical protein